MVPGVSGGQGGLVCCGSWGHRGGVAPGVGGKQGGLVCCGPWGHRVWVAPGVGGGQGGPGVLRSVGPESLGGSRSWWWAGVLVCCSPWSLKESDTTELSTATQKLLTE